MRSQRNPAWAYAAWLLYKLDVRGWWLILIALVVFMVSAVMTYARHDIIEMYQLMGYSDQTSSRNRCCLRRSETYRRWRMIFVRQGSDES